MYADEYRYEHRSFVGEGLLELFHAVDGVPAFDYCQVGVQHFLGDALFVHLPQIHGTVVASGLETWPIISSTVWKLSNITRQSPVTAK